MQALDWLSVIVLTLDTMFCAALILDARRYNREMVSRVKYGSIRYRG